MVALAIVLVVLFLLAVMRFGAFACYSEEGFVLRVIAGPVRITLFPQKTKKADKDTLPRKGKPKEEKRKETDKEKKGGPIELIKKFAPPVLDTLGRLRRKLRIDSLTIYFTSAAEDPYDTAMNFGRVSAAECAFIPVLDHVFKIKKRDIRTDISFDDNNGNKIYLKAQLTIALWEIIYVACGLLPLLRQVKSESKDGKADNNERTSNR